MVDHLPPSVQRLRKSGALPLLLTPSWNGHKQLANSDSNISVSFHRTMLHCGSSTKCVCVMLVAKVWPVMLPLQPCPKLSSENACVLT
jgi:hypothetical protein